MVARCWKLERIFFFPGKNDVEPERTKTHTDHVLGYTMILSRQGQMAGLIENASNSGLYEWYVKVQRINIGKISNHT